MKNKVLCLSIIILLLSCSEKEKQPKDILSLFTKVQKISHKSFPNNSDYIIGSGSFLCLTGDQLIIEDERDQYLMLLYSLKDSCFTKRFIPYGQGPEEFLSVKKIQVKSDTSFYLFDLIEKKFTEYAFYPYCTNNINERKIHSIDWKKEMPFNVIKTKDYYVLMNSVEDGLFTLCGDNGDKIKSFLSYPTKDKKEKNLENIYKAFAYQGQLTVRPGTNQFAFMPVWAPIIQFFHIENSAIHKDKEYLFGYVDYVTDNESSAINSASPVISISSYATDHYLYLVYSGQSTKEKGAMAFSGNEILVFDWSGNPICRYQTDISIKSICIDNNDNYLWAIGYNPDPELISFDLSH